MIRLISFLLIAAGGVIMVMTIVSYHRLLAYSRKETYEANKAVGVGGIVSLVMMYLFLFGFAVGAVDVATREVEPIYLFIAIIFFVGALFINMSVRVQRHMAENLRNKNLETMRAFVSAIDLKDAYTKGHSHHVYEITRLFCEQLPNDYLRELSVPKLLDAALLHDIGKISIHDEILNKEGELTKEEWEILRTHPRRGIVMLEDTCYSEISDWVLYHHERIDGKGYYGARADEIPLESKIIAIADTYSALCTNRIYRKKRSYKEAAEIMREAAGTQLDAELLNCFFKIGEVKLSGLLEVQEPQIEYRSPRSNIAGEN